MRPRPRRVRTFEIVQVGVVNAIVCTDMPIAEAAERLWFLKKEGLL